MSVGSEPATSGSVMAKQERAVPSHSGRRYFSFCSGVPQCSMRVLVALVGRLGVDDERPDADLGRLGRDRGHGRRPEAHATPLRRHVRQPDAPVLAGHAAQLDDGLDHLASLPLVDRLPLGPDDVVHEGSDLEADLLHLGREREVDHGPQSGTRPASRADSRR